jgi:hypothetical protein
MKECCIKYAANSDATNSTWNKVIEYYYDHVHFEVYGITFNSWLDRDFKARIVDDDIVFKDEKYMNWFLLKFQ